MKAKSREELITEIVQLHAKLTMLELQVHRCEKERAELQQSPKAASTEGPGTFVEAESQALIHSLAEGFEGEIYICSPDYRLLFLNSQCRQRAGEEAVGRICYKAIHKRDTPCAFCVHDQIQRGQSVRFENVNPRDGHRYLSINRPIRQRDGRIAMLAMVRDINDRKFSEAPSAADGVEAQGKEHSKERRSELRQTFGRLVGKSAAMQAIYDKIVKAADTDATVIIYGEPGTGKELVAQAIHSMSDRSEHRFVPVHCGAIPENLIESEFFGYKKGAFSGAIADRQGYFDYAHGGTLFLDEIGEISLHLQIKLLRVIEGIGFTPVGGNQVKQSDCRIIAATNRDLRERIHNGHMREDFYYRIHILPIWLPPLRERKEDLPLLIDHFFNRYGGRKKSPPLTRPMIDKLTGYDWPGNIRELQNVIIRYCSLQVLELGIAVPSESSPGDGGSLRVEIDPSKDLKAMMALHERRLIGQALERSHWHRGKAAEQLGVDRKTLFSKMKRYKLG